MTALQRIETNIEKLRADGRRLLRLALTTDGSAGAFSDKAAEQFHGADALVNLRIEILTMERPLCGEDAEANRIEALEKALALVLGHLEFVRQHGAAIGGGLPFPGVAEAKALLGDEGAAARAEENAQFRAEAPGLLDAANRQGR